MFLTCTYDETKTGYHNSFEYSDIQKFKKRLRSYVSRNFDGRKIEIFNVHEYGKNGKKHWHLIVFGFAFKDQDVHTIKNQIPLYTSKKLTELWPHGFSTIGDVSEASAMYQAQYMEKDFKNGNVTSQKKSHSKHSGLGKPYFQRHYDQILRLGYIPFSGRKLPIPRYFLKLAHKHYCHFYEKSAFFDTPWRKALHRPFKKEEANKQIADLYIQYQDQRLQHVKELEKEFDAVISQYIFDKHDPEFVRSGSNVEYDFHNKQKPERF